MALTVDTEASTVKLTSLEYIKTELNITDQNSDLELRRFINQASSFIPSYTNRVFCRETVTETLGANGDVLLILERTPIVSINAISMDGTTIGATTFSIEDADAGFLFRDVGWQDTQIWRSNLTLIPTHRFKKRWSVSYTAGYVCHESTHSGDPNIPADIERAATDLVKSWYLSREQDSNVKRERTGDASETRFDNKESAGLPPGVMRLLAPYRRLV